jgi:hypothetical protein
MSFLLTLARRGLQAIVDQPLITRLEMEGFRAFTLRTAHFSPFPALNRKDTGNLSQGPT